MTLPLATSLIKYKAFSGRAPFADSTPVTVAVKVLSGQRPERPKDPVLTNELWDLTRRCFDQDPRRRPEITVVVRDLQEALAVRQYRTDATDVARVDGTTFGDTPQRKSSFRTPSFIAPVSKSRLQD